MLVQCKEKRMPFSRISVQIQHRQSQAKFQLRYFPIYHLSPPKGKEIVLFLTSYKSSEIKNDNIELFFLDVLVDFLQSTSACLLF